MVGRDPGLEAGQSQAGGGRLRSGRRNAGGLPWRYNGNSSAGVVEGS